MRERGNFSFVRIYESGHQVPYFQRKWIFDSLGGEGGKFGDKSADLNLKHLLRRFCSKDRLQV